METNLTSNFNFEVPYNHPVCVHARKMNCLLYAFAFFLMALCLGRLAIGFHDYGVGDTVAFSVLGLAGLLLLCSFFPLAKLRQRSQDKDRVIKLVFEEDKVQIDNVDYDYVKNNRPFYVRNVTEYDDQIQIQVAKKYGMVGEYYLPKNLLVGMGGLNEIKTFFAK